MADLWQKNLIADSDSQVEVTDMFEKLPKTKVAYLRFRMIGKSETCGRSLDKLRPSSELELSGNPAETCGRSLPKCETSDKSHELESEVASQFELQTVRRSL